MLGNRRRGAGCPSVEGNKSWLSTYVVLRYGPLVCFYLGLLSLVVVDSVSVRLQNGASLAVVDSASVRFQDGASDVPPLILEDYYKIL